MTQIPTFPLLLKATTGGGVQEWQISVEAEGNNGVIIVRYGLSDGKKQELRQVVT
jgi:hypothetical protein